MRWLLVTLLVIHGLIHLMGPAKAFGLADLSQLTEPISRVAGLVWLAAALAMIGVAVQLVWAPGSWWMTGLGAVLLSQGVIFSAWSDAKFGTVANVILLAAVVQAIARGPLGLGTEYERAVGRRLSSLETSPRLTEADLQPLPELVRRYVLAAGAVGQPRVQHFSVRFRGRIRQAADEPWMEFTSEQHNFIDPPARFFLMDAEKGGLPVDVLHVFEDGVATMRVRLLSLLQIVDAKGPEMDRSETVTFFNDLCLMAPGALIDPRIRWRPLDDRSVRADFTIGTQTIGAVLTFNEVGELVDFVSDDRFAASADGTEFVRQRWSTPVSTYGEFGPLRLFSRAEGRWDAPDGAFSYFEADVLDVVMNVRATTDGS